MDAKSLFIAILRAQMRSEDLCADGVASIDDGILEDLFRLSKHHDCAHIVGELLDRMGRLPENSRVTDAFRQEYMLAAFRNTRICDEQSQISDLFESLGIAHVLLKGAVIRAYYPASWMRTSCDIDILVREENFELARAALEEKLGYKYDHSTLHDISLMSPTGVNLELHHSLMEDYIAPESSKILLGVWEDASLAEGRNSTYVLTDAFFYFYHIVHMAKHFIYGGCGVKSFMDTYILCTAIEYDEAARASFFDKGSEFHLFEKGVRDLTFAWFADAEMDEQTSFMAEYVLSGGTYGTVENRTGVGIAKKKGKFSYFMSRMFLSRDIMFRTYPVLNKHKWLLPFFHIKRWFRIIFCGGIKRARSEIDRTNSVTEEQNNSTKQMLSSLGLIS